MKVALGAIALVAIVAIGAVVLMAGRIGGDDDGKRILRNTLDPRTTATTTTCKQTIAWGDAASCNGKSITVKGPVAGSSYKPEVGGKPTYINIGNDFPDTRHLEVIIWGSCRTNFATAPEAAYRGKSVYVTGTVALRDGVPQVEVCSPEQITTD